MLSLSDLINTLMSVTPSTISAHFSPPANSALPSFGCSVSHFCRFSLSKANYFFKRYWNLYLNKGPVNENFLLESRLQTLGEMAKKRAKPKLQPNHVCTGDQDKEPNTGLHRADLVIKTGIWSSYWSRNKGYRKSQATLT